MVNRANSVGNWSGIFVSVFSVESWGGELEEHQALICLANVSVFSVESWGGEQLV